jgi:hypothetical protein
MTGRLCDLNGDWSFVVVLSDTMEWLGLGFRTAGSE